MYLIMTVQCTIIVHDDRCQVSAVLQQSVIVTKLELSFFSSCDHELFDASFAVEQILIRENDGTMS